jgi:MFS family permease
MDETVVNGAQIVYSKQFGIGDKNSDRDSWLLGLVNSAPYLCCAFIGCWLTIPFNKWFGRRGTIFLTCTLSALACFWQAFTNTWWHVSPHNPKFSRTRLSRVMLTPATFTTRTSAQRLTYSPFIRCSLHDSLLDLELGPNLRLFQFMLLSVPLLGSAVL